MDTVQGGDPSGHLCIPHVLGGGSVALSQGDVKIIPETSQVCRRLLLQAMVPFVTRILFGKLLGKYGFYTTKEDWKKHIEHYVIDTADV